MLEMRQAAVLKLLQGKYFELKCEVFIDLHNFFCNFKSPTTQAARALQNQDLMDLAGQSARRQRRPQAPETEAAPQYRAARYKAKLKELVLFV